VCAATVSAVLLAACGSSGLPASSRSAESLADPDTSLDGTQVGDDPTTSVLDGGQDAQPAGSSSNDSGGAIAIDAGHDGVAFDHRLLGTNVPAWIGPQRLADPDFIAETLGSGTTLIRMPGGSWSNAYDWHACEIGDEDGCYWTWAARPTDFIDFMQATGLPGMFTASLNETPQHAAAGVAFFNGEVGDDTPIGVDRDGVDWGTVDTWATLRSEGGNPEPAPILLWEIGNEVYGGKPEQGGPECASYGWEDVWTCDGTDYVLGDGEHEGYLAFRDAMQAVDPTIEVGAVGVPDPAGWNDWGNEVITEAGDALDFYVVHQYGFDSSPDALEALARPAELWPQVMSDVRGALGDDTPIAVTEYNLVSIPSRDTEQAMTKAMNALYIADSVGQLALYGASIANQWDLASGTDPSSGTNYGMFNIDDDAPGYEHLPQYEGLAMWSHAGSVLLPPTIGESLHVYPTRHDDGRVTMIVINLGLAASRTFDITGDPARFAPAAGVTVTSVGADDPRAAAMNERTVEELGEVGPSFTVELPAWSITAIEIEPADG
jgi:hypothetical protein